MSEMTIDTPFFFALFPSFISAEYRSITYDGSVAIKQLKSFSEMHTLSLIHISEPTRPY